MYLFLNQKVLGQFLKLIISLSILYSNSSFSQDFSLIRKNEDSLALLVKKISASENDLEQKQYNLVFRDLLKTTLEIPNSMDYPFDSLNMLSELSDKEKGIRIFTWQLETQNQQYQYFGLIRFSASGKIVVIPLSDTVFDHAPGERDILSDQKWYGSIYYDFRIHEINDTTVLTVLGRRRLSDQVFRKSIEFISIAENGSILFGKRNLLKNYPKPVSRAFFDYPVEIPLTLRFEKEAFVKGKKKSRLMIVFHRLVNDRVIDKYNMPIPDYETFDGFVFGNNSWNYIRDIDLRVDNEKLPKREKKKPELNLFE